MPHQWPDSNDICAEFAGRKYLSRINMRIPIVISISVAVFAVGFSQVDVNAAEPFNNSPPLPGSVATMEAAISRVDVIATGVFVDLGGADGRAPGGFVYHDAKFKITKFLKGTCKSPVTLVLCVAIFPVREEVKEGVEYVVFFAGPSDPAFPLFVAKLMPADRDTVSKVTAAIKAAPPKP